jgi:hypothetical protein
MDFMYIGRMPDMLLARELPVGRVGAGGRATNMHVSKSGDKDIANESMLPSIASG